MGTLKYNDTEPSALKFDKPLGITSGSMATDFQAWTRNTDQPGDGIIIKKDRIIVSKFRPNVPIIVSALDGAGTGNTPTVEELCTASRTGSSCKLIGMTDENRAMLIPFSKTNLVLTWWDAYLVGPCFIPYNTYLNAEINVAVDVRQNIVYYGSESTEVLAEDHTLRGDGGGYGRIGYLYNRASYVNFLPGWKSFPDGGVNHHWQLAFGIYTSAPTQDGIITLDTPIVFKRINADRVDVTTVEAFYSVLASSAYDGEEMYSKPRTFQNLLMNYGLAFEEGQESGDLNGKYTEAIQDVHDEIINSYGGKSHVAYVVSGRNYDFAYATEYPYSQPYDYLRLPKVDDLSELIVAGFPFKIWADLTTTYSSSGSTNLQSSLYSAFASTRIRDAKFADHLFAKSKFSLSELYINFDVGENNTIAFGSIFDHSEGPGVLHIHIYSGEIKTLHNAFRSNTTTYAFNFSKKIYVGDFQGAFEGATAANITYPENVALANIDWYEELGAKYSEPVCKLEYAADGSGLATFGIWKDLYASAEADKYYIATVAPSCRSVFSRSTITQVKYVLDMKFVTPRAIYYDQNSGTWIGGICESDNPLFSSVFGKGVSGSESSLTDIKIKNLNKGNWSLDGVARNDANGRSCCAGNLYNLNSDSATYLLNNIFDLTRNNQSTGDTSHFENPLNSFNGWTASNGYKTPVSFSSEQNGAQIMYANITTAGTLTFKFTGTGCSVVIYTNGQANTYEPSNTERTINIYTGLCSISFEKNPNAESMVANIELTDHFDSALTPGLTSANIYLPDGFQNKITSGALSAARGRGWHVYINGSEVTSL